MTMTYLYHPEVRVGHFGSPLTASAGIPNLNDLLQTCERPLLPRPRPRLYYGRVILDPARVGHDAGLISGEIIYPLRQIAGSLVTVALDIVADVADGIPRNLVCNITESGRKLKFTDQGFA